MSLPAFAWLCREGTHTNVMAIAPAIGETRRPIVAKIGTAQPDPKAAIAARAAAKEQERERKRAALPTLKANAFKADYQPRWSSLRAGSPANYGPLSKGGDQCTASGRN
eukprot:SAG31_NODE_1057_length_10129_cov_29.441376_4_plen_109_part_00